MLEWQLWGRGTDVLIEVMERETLLRIDRARIKAYRDMLVVLRERMRAELVAGKSLDEIIAARITSDYAKEWPGGHDRFVRLLYQELSKQ